MFKTRIRSSVKPYIHSGGAQRVNGHNGEASFMGRGASHFNKEYRVGYTYRILEAICVHEMEEVPCRKKSQGLHANIDKTHM